MELQTPAASPPAGETDQKRWPVMSPDEYFKSSN